MKRSETGVRLEVCTQLRCVSSEQRRSRAFVSEVMVCRDVLDVRAKSTAYLGKECSDRWMTEERGVHWENESHPCEHFLATVNLSENVVIRL